MFILFSLCNPITFVFLTIIRNLFVFRQPASQFPFHSVQLNLLSLWVPPPIMGGGGFSEREAGTEVLQQQESLNVDGTPEQLGSIFWSQKDASVTF